MIITREEFIPTVNTVDEISKIYYLISRNKKGYSVDIESTENNYSKKFSTLRQVWEFIESNYEMLSPLGITFIVIDKDSRSSIEISFGLGKNTILEKLKSIKLKENSIKRIANTNRRMVVENRYHSRSKKVDTRIFDRKRYASSSSRGI